MTAIAQAMKKAGVDTNAREQQPNADAARPPHVARGEKENR
jgi:hypothetical protein